MNCEDVMDQLGDYLDLETREELRPAIEAHLHHCPDCKFHYDTVRHTLVLYHEADRSRTLEIPVRVTRRLAAALAAEYERGADGGD